MRKATKIERSVLLWVALISFISCISFGSLVFVLNKTEITTTTSSHNLHDDYCEKKIERGMNSERFDYGSWMDSGAGYPESVNEALGEMCLLCLLIIWTLVTAGPPFIILFLWVNRDRRSA